MLNDLEQKLNNLDLARRLGLLSSEDAEKAVSEATVRRCARCLFIRRVYDASKDGRRYCVKCQEWTVDLEEALP